MRMMSIAGGSHLEMATVAAATSGVDRLDETTPMPATAEEAENFGCMVLPGLAD